MSFRPLKRRTVLKALPTLPLLPAALTGTANAAVSEPDPKTIAPSMRASRQEGSDIAKKLTESGEPHSDMSATDPDGNPQAR